MMKVSGCVPDSTAPPDPEADALVDEAATSTSFTGTADQGLRTVAPSPEAEPGAPSETRYIGVSYLSKRAVNFTIRRTGSGSC